MSGVKLSLLVFAVVVGVAWARGPSAADLAYDVYNGCLSRFSASCVKPKALAWMSAVADEPVIRITEDLVIVKKDDPEPLEEQRGATQDIFDRFDNFLQTHDLVARVPEILRADGPLGSLVPRSFTPEDVAVPLAATGRSKVVKKVIVPFLLGLKFKTAVLVPLALALIALKTWKALTLGLLSMVLTAAMVIFKFTKPKVVNYEVIHYPHHVDHHFDHHVDHHVEHPPVATGGWDHAGYGREMSGNEMAYNAQIPE